MAWQPLKTDANSSRLSPATRNLISRGTCAVIAILLCWASYKDLSWCMRARAAAIEQSQQRTVSSAPRQRVISGTGLPMIVGIGLGLGGAVMLLGAVMPTRFWEHFVSPPGDPHEEADNLKRILRRGSRL